MEANTGAPFLLIPPESQYNGTLEEYLEDKGSMAPPQMHMYSEPTPPRNTAQSFLQLMQQTNAFTGIEVPTARSTIPIHNPADLVKELEQEQNELKLLHRKISDQLHRLQIEEVVLKKQVETYRAKHEQGQMKQTVSSSLPPVTATPIITPSFPMDTPVTTSISNEEMEEHVDEDEDEDLIVDDEDTENMRKILSQELGDHYASQL